MKKYDLLSYNHFRAGSAWIILIVGIILYYCGYFRIQEASLWKEIIIKIADVLVIGVIIGYLSNAAQFLGVFKQDLQDIIYGKEFLSKRNDITPLWETVSKELFKSKFPAISKELLSLIKSNYFPVNEINYYDDYDVNIEITWADEAHQYLLVKDTRTFDLIAETPNRFELPFGSWTNVKDVPKALYYSEVKKYTINEKEARIIDEKKIVENDVLYHEVIAELKGSTKYEITQVREKKYLFDRDYDISFRAKYIIHKLKVRLCIPDDLEATFLCRGTAEDFKDVNSKENCLEKRYKGLILPRQGYVFILKRKNMKHNLENDNEG